MAFKYKKYKQSDTVKRYKKEAQANANYKESQDVIDARNKMKEHEANKVADWTGGQYGQQVKDYMDKIANREKFSYDINNDALYQQYKDRYMRQGQLAMQDTIGQASALTGGYGSSYAETVGNQAYQSYLQDLNDVVPELYQMAYDRYNQEGQDMYNQLGMYQNAYNTEYGEYRDKVADWQTEQQRLDSAYMNVANLDWGKFESTRNYMQDRYVSERDYHRAKYESDRDVAKDAYQFAKNLALQKAQLAEERRHNLATESAARASASGGGSRSSGGSSASSSKSGGTNSWGAGEWESYFANYRQKYGASAAQKKLSSTSVPNKYMSAAAIGARGKLGH